MQRENLIFKVGMLFGTVPYQPDNKKTVFFYNFPLRLIIKIMRIRDAKMRQFYTRLSTLQKVTERLETRHILSSFLAEITSERTTLQMSRFFNTLLENFLSEISHCSYIIKSLEYGTWATWAVLDEMGWYPDSSIHCGYCSWHRLSPFYLTHVHMEYDHLVAHTFTANV